MLMVTTSMLLFSCICRQCHKYSKHMLCHKRRQYIKYSRFCIPAKEEYMSIARCALIFAVFTMSHLVATTYLGEYNNNQYDPNSISNPYGVYGSPYSPNSVNNPYGVYGSPYSSQSANNPYATSAPKIYDQNGNYRGKLSANPYDPDSISNPYGTYGSPYSASSVNNPYGARNPYSSNGINIYGE